MMMLTACLCGKTFSDDNDDEILHFFCISDVPLSVTLCVAELPAVFVTTDQSTNIETAPSHHHHHHKAAIIIIIII